MYLVDSIEYLSFFIQKEWKAFEKKLSGQQRACHEIQVVQQFNFCELHKIKRESISQQQKHLFAYKQHLQTKLKDQMFILKLQTLMLRNRPVLLKRRGSHTAFTDQQTFTTMKPLQPNKNKIIQNACLRELVDAVFVFLYIVSTNALVRMYQYRRHKKMCFFPAPLHFSFS